MTFANREQAEFWSQLAPTWLDIEDQLEQVSGPPGEMAMDRLGLRAGQRVVDLGCGSGRTTLELASRVAPGGVVLGVDIAAEMLVRGRASGHRALAYETSSSSTPTSRYRTWAKTGLTRPTRGSE